MPMHFLSALATSLLLFLGSPGEFFWAPFMWAALVPLLITVNKSGPKQAAKIGLLCGFFYYAPLLYWILIVLGRYGNLPPLLSVPALLLLALYMSLYLAVFCAGVAWAKNHLPVLWTAPALWVSLDFLRGLLLTGFPWLDLGYSQFQNILLIQLADLTGHHGITFLIVLVNCMIFSFLQYWEKRDRQILLKQLLPAALIILAAFSYNIGRSNFIAKEVTKSPTITTGIIQGNIDQSEKWLPDLQEKTVNDYLSMSHLLLGKKKHDLLLWPETALPFFPLDHPLFIKIADSIMQPDGPVFLTGAPHFTLDPNSQAINYYNSAFVLAPIRHEPLIKDEKDHTIKRYDKQHLVPFGEYIPFSRFLPSSTPLVQSMGNFTPGSSLEPISCDNIKIGVLICYESIFPDLARKETRKGANVLVNLTNDAWYGKSSAPWQQLAMVIFRAVENRRSLARAANTGISGFIDPIGNQIAISPLFEPYEMTAELPLLTEASPFVRYGHFFPHLCLLALMPMAFQIIRKKKRINPT